MHRTWKALSLALLALLPVAAAAQDPPPPADPVAAELARVNATLKEIAALLNRQSDLQSVDLLMKRVQLSQSQVADIERRLRSSEGELRSLETERTNLEMRLKMFTTQIERGGAGDVPTSEFESMSVQTEEELKRNRRRIAELRQEVAALEGELGSRQDEMRSWQSVLDRRLAKQGG